MRRAAHSARRSPALAAPTALLVQCRQRLRVLLLAARVQRPQLLELAIDDRERLVRGLRLLARLGELALRVADDDCELAFALVQHAELLAAARRGARRSRAAVSCSAVWRSVMRTTASLASPRRAKARSIRSLTRRSSAPASARAASWTPTADWAPCAASEAARSPSLSEAISVVSTPQRSAATASSVSRSSFSSARNSSARLAWRRSAPSWRSISRITSLTRREVLDRALELALAGDLAAAEQRRARRLLDEQAQLLGLRGDDLADAALLDHRVGLGADTAAEEELGDVAQPRRRVVDEVVRLAGAEDLTLDGELGETRDVRRQPVLLAGDRQAAGIGLLEGQHDLGEVERRALRVAAEDDVLHLLGAQMLDALLAERPADRVGDVRLAAAVRTDDRVETRRQGEARVIAKRFETEQLDLTDAHTHLLVTTLAHQLGKDTGLFPPISGSSQGEPLAVEVPRAQPTASGSASSRNDRNGRHSP